VSECEGFLGAYIDGFVDRWVVVRWINGWMCRYVRGGWVDKWMDVSVSG